jgi:hypothetical protein
MLADVEMTRWAIASHDAAMAAAESSVDMLSDGQLGPHEVGMEVDERGRADRQAGNDARPGMGSHVCTE